MAGDLPLSRAPQRLGGRSIAGLRWGGTTALLALLLLAHRSIVATSLAAPNPLAPLARIFDLILLGAVLLLAHAMGARLLLLLGLRLPTAEQVAIACALGLGLLAYAFLGLGAIGLYRAPLLLVALVVIGGFLRHDLLTTVYDTQRWWAGRGWRPDTVTPAVAGLCLLLAASAVLALFGALTPPHHYDPLTYHLAIPQHYLRTGSLGKIPEIEASSLPMTIELLFGLGLGFGSEAFPQLLHLAFAGISALAIWGFARRRFDPHTGWLAVAVFLSTPLVPIWSRVADNDLALGCFIFLAFVCAVEAQECTGTGEGQQSRRWLVVAGIFAGLAMATKYQAGFAIAPLSVMVLVGRGGMLPGKPWSRAQVRGVLRAALIFGGMTALVAAPWYLQNLSFLVGIVRVLLLVNSAGATSGAQALDPTTDLTSMLILSPRTPLGYALLPLRAYLRGDLEQRYVVPNPLFLALPLLSILPRWWRRTEVRGLALITAGFLVGWAIGVQELRYLLAICPLLAIGTSLALSSLWERLALRRLVRGGLAVAAVLTLALTFLHVGADRPLRISLGLESRDAYLARSATFGGTYRATRFLLAQLGPQDQALFIHELQTYYLPATANVRTRDARQIMYALVDDYATPQEAIEDLRGEGVTYVLVNEADIRWWAQTAPNGRLARTKAGFDQIAAQLDLVYRDGPAERPLISIYRIPSAGSSR